MLHTLQQYNGDSIYLTIFVISIVLLYCGRRQESCGIGSKSAVAALLSVLLVFNGAAYWVIGRFTDTTTYYRFFWMLPVVFVPACLLAQQLLSGKRMRVAVAVCALACCMCVGGNFFVRAEHINRPHNIYGLDPDTIAMSEAVMADWVKTGEADESQPADGPVVALDIYLEYQVRTYEPRITWAISRKAYLYQAEHGYDYKTGKYIKQQRVIAAVNEGLREDAAALRRSLDGLDTDYLVIRTEFCMDDYLAGIGVVPIASQGRYTLYRVERQAAKLPEGNDAL